MNDLFRGLVPICRKEFLHIIRDRGTLFFALLLPMLQLFLFGFAIDTNVRQIPTVVFDESHTQESRRLVQSFTASDVFTIKANAVSSDEVYEDIRSGRASVALRIPYDYARKLQAGIPAAVEVLIDGSDSTVAGEAVNTFTGIVLERSLMIAIPNGTLPIDLRPSILYNPAMRSANFLCRASQLCSCRS